jgi:hypothetical protein
VPNHSACVSLSWTLLPLISGLLLLTLPLQTVSLPEKSNSQPNREEADSGPASRIGRDGSVLFLEESRALAEPEFVLSVYEVGLLCGAIDTLPS